MNVEQLINDGPREEVCFIQFIVEGSVMHSFYNNSKYIHELKVPIITE